MNDDILTVGLMYRDAWSAGVYSILGLDSRKIDPDINLFLSFVHPDDRTEGLEAALVSRQPVQPHVFRLVRHRGQIAYASLHRMEIDLGKVDLPLCLLELDPVGRDTFHGLCETSLADIAGTRGVGFWTVLDEGGGAITCSPKTLEILGLHGRERVSVSDLVTFTAGDDQLRLAKFFKAEAHGDGSLCISFGFRRASDGSLRRIELTAVIGRCRFGGVALRHGTAADVTAAALQTRCADRQHAVRQALSSIRDDAVLVLDANDLIEDVSGPIADHLGFNPSEGSCGSVALPAVIWTEVVAAREAENGVRVVRCWSTELARQIKVGICPVGRRTVLVFPDNHEVDTMQAALREAENAWAERCEAARCIVVDGHEGRSPKLRFGVPGPGRTGEGLAFSRRFRACIDADDLARLDAAVAGGRREGPVVMPFHVRGENGRETYLLRGEVLRSDRGAGRFVGLASESLDPVRPPDGGERAAPVEICLAPEQMRAARGALNWSVRILSEKSGVSVATINRLESEIKTVCARGTSIEAIWRAFVAAGITFAMVDGSPAIVIRAS